MKDLLDYLKNELSSEVSEVVLEDARIGLVYTGVLLSSGHAAVAYTPIQELHECPVIDYAGSITGTEASEIMKMALSPNLVEAAVGIATVNALSQIVFETYPEKYVFSDVDVLDLIQPQDKVTMVGYFGPLIPKILEKTNLIYVLEKRTIDDDRVKLVHPSHASKALSNSEVVLISGSTLVNKTVNKILKQVTNARESVLLGPTASITPQPFFKKGATAVMGVKITDPQKMLQVVSEAGGTRQLLSTCAEKTAFLKETNERHKILLQPI